MADQPIKIGQAKIEAEVTAQPIAETPVEAPPLKLPPKLTEEEYNQRLTQSINQPPPTPPTPESRTPTPAQPEAGTPTEESPGEEPKAEAEAEKEPQEAEEEGGEEGGGSEEGAGQEQEDQTAAEEKVKKTLRERFNNWRASVAQKAKKNLSKEGAKKAWGAILKFLIANWPWVLAAFVILLLMGILFAACSKQSGKTPYRKADPVADKVNDQEVLAGAGDPTAQREIYANKINDLKKDLGTIQTNNAEAQKKLDQMGQLIDEMGALTESPDALREKINQILTLIEHLKKLAPELTGPLDALKAKLESLRALLDFYKTIHLVLNPIDMQYIREFDLDSRILAMLAYLIRPKDQGGAGYERLRVKRIKVSYDTDFKALSKETEFADNEEPNISAHYTGQAADISEIDCIKCTQIKRRRLGSEEKTPLPPTPIKIAWQSEYGYAQAGGPDAYGANMHQVFNNLGSGSINDMIAVQLSDVLGIDIDPALLRGKNLGEITRFVGVAILKNKLDIPGDYQLGASFDDIVKATGQAYIAQALGIPMEGIEGNSQEDLMVNIGRAIVEQKMNLPSGALKGDNSQAILTTVGQRQLEETLSVSRGTLAIPFSDQNTLKRNLGQGRVEASLGLKPQTFYGALAEVKKRLGKDMFEVTFANPSVIDNWLGLSATTTDRLLKGQVSLEDYNQMVGASVFKEEIMVYEDPKKRAEAFGLDPDDFANLLAGHADALHPIGRTIISRVLSPDEKEQESLRFWLWSKTPAPELDLDYLGGQYGLKDGDLEKIFTQDAGRPVFHRLGQVTVLDKLENKPQLNQYLQPVMEVKFYTDRLMIIKDNVDYLQNHANDPEIRQKAGEIKQTVDKTLTNFSITNARKTMKQIQTNVKFIKDRAQKNNDAEVLRRIEATQKAMDEIIEGREIKDFDQVDPSTATAKTDPQLKLTKKDILKVLMGTEKVEDLAYRVGLRKWEIELDLPNGSFDHVLDDLKKTDYKNPDDTLLVNIGQAKLKEYGSITWRDSSRVDKDLGLTSGTTADYRAGRLTPNGYYKKIGMVVVQSNVAARLINPQLHLKNPQYALTGSDITKLLNGGWFYVALKIGGSSIDQAMGFPPGGTLDIIQQVTEAGDIPQMLAEKKLGLLAGLNRAVSLNGEIIYNLGQVKIEQELWLNANTINDENLIAYLADFTNTDEDNLSRLDAAFGLSGATSQKLLDHQVKPHDYITLIGANIRNSVLYDQIAKNAPELQGKDDLKELVLALASQTGTPQEILQAAGAQRLGRVLGLDYPISIRGNFKNNLGEAKIEDRLGLKRDSFRPDTTTSDIISANGQRRFEAAFYISAGQLDEARNANSGYWMPENKHKANLVDIILNIPSGKTEDFLTGRLYINDYLGLIGENSLMEVTVDKLVDLMDLEDKYKFAAQDVVNVIGHDPSLSQPGSQRQLFETFMGLAGKDWDNQTKFDPGTWENILFVDPNNPERTGPGHAPWIILEQGKKWLPRWLGVKEKYEPYIDLIYEKVYGQVLIEGRFLTPAQVNQNMVDAVKEATGIPDDKDAGRLLNGDVKGGLTAWGAAQLVKMYNKEFEGTSGITLDYQTVKTAYFNDPDKEKTIADAAVAKAREAVTDPTMNPNGKISPDYEQEVRQDAIREHRDAARKKVMYAATDMQLHKIDNAVPAGFTQAMREGTSEQKWNMGLQYIGNKVHEKNPEIPAEILPDLQKYFDPKSPDYQKAEALSGATYSFLDSKMKDWLGDFVQDGTAQALFKYGQTGKFGSTADVGSLPYIYLNYGINIVTNWADKTMKLPPGTTIQIYNFTVQYQAAVQAYKAAKQALLVATYVTQTKEAIDAAQTAKAAAEAKVEAVEAAFYTFIVTTVFQKQLLAMDQSLGLVPGSSAMLVGMGIEYLITGAVNPWAIALFVVTNLFGTYRVDVVCTACGYYPDDNSSNWNSSLLGLIFKPKPKPNPLACPLGEFNGKSADAFKTNSMAAAQYKVNHLIGDLLNMPKALNNPDMLPTQIMTYRQEDVDSFASQLNDLYGSAAFRMNSGLWANNLMWDHIHIGY